MQIPHHNANMILAKQWHIAAAQSLMDLTAVALTSAGTTGIRA